MKKRHEHKHKLIRHFELCALVQLEAGENPYQVLMALGKAWYDMLNICANEPILAPDPFLKRVRSDLESHMTLHAASAATTPLSNSCSVEAVISNTQK